MMEKTGTARLHTFGVPRLKASIHDITTGYDLSVLQLALIPCIIARAVNQKGRSRERPFWSVFPRGDDSVFS